MSLYSELVPGWFEPVRFHQTTPQDFGNIMLRCVPKRHLCSWTDLTETAIGACDSWKRPCPRYLVQVCRTSRFRCSYTKRGKGFGFPMEHRADKKVTGVHRVRQAALSTADEALRYEKGLHRIWIVLEKALHRFWIVPDRILQPNKDTCWPGSPWLSIGG